MSSDDAGASRARFGYRLALFRSEYDNLIDFDPGPPARLVNRSEVEIRGYEASAAARVTERAHVRASITGLSFDLPPDVPPLRSRPRFRASAAATYAITPEWSASLFGSWVGRVFDSSIPTGGMALSPYLLVDASLAYAARGARLVLAADNLLDRDYQQFIGFPARGRRARIELSLDI
jgi:iron complex outermembrane receptor protein/vitamin B12 transporter